ncbi:MAG: N-acetylglucosamine-6-phosphate deacetylase [Pseudomonadota bacterium]
MTGSALTFRNGRIFDGVRFYDNHHIRFENDRFVSLEQDRGSITSGDVVDLAGDILFPGFVDLQVNGGDGVQFNSNPSVETLERIAKAHRSLGVTAFLPTLITDSLEKTNAAISAACAAITRGVPGIAGLHLEGPHLSITRKGAHDASLIRRMDASDLESLLVAAQKLPLLKVTVAPENVTEEQVRRLADAGVLVSLGHTDADYATCRRYFKSGARCVTHLFNAMSQLGNREPGLVGAALADGTVSSGLIADAVHVHPETIAAAWRAKAGPGRIFLVSDAMAVAGSQSTEFELGGRKIRRDNGILTLADGTLAGADLDLATAARTMVNQVGISPLLALEAATSIPARLIGLDYGFNDLSNVVRLASDFSSVKVLRETCDADARA